MLSESGGNSSESRPRGSEPPISAEPHSVADIESQQPQGTSRASDLDYPFKYNDFKTIEDMCFGWQRYAAEQDVYRNYGIQRRFGQEHQYFLCYKQRKICALYKQALDHDELGVLYKDRSFENQDKRSQITSLDNVLLDKLGEEILQYKQHIKLDRELRDFPRIPLREHKYLYQHMRIGHGFEEEDCAFMLAPEDCISTRTDHRHHIVERLIYEYPDCWLLWPFRMTSSGNGRFFNADNMDIIFKVVSIGLCEALLLIPTIVLDLIPLTKGQTVGAIALFVFIFASALAVLPKIKFEVILLGLCAFMAVIIQQAQICL